MKKQTRGSSPIHPLAWIAGIAVIVFSAVGIAAFMGWIPTSMGNSGSGAMTEAPAAGANAKTAPARIASSTPAHTSKRCADCGVIESVRSIESKGEGSGLGAVGGAVVGGVLGHQVGGGRGKDVMTVVCAVGGAMAGNEVEKRAKSTQGYAVTVRLDDGTTHVFNQTSAPNWRVGDRVRIVDGVIRSNA